MVPVEPAVIRRQAPVPARPEARDAEIEADDSEKRSEQRRPDDDLAPELTVAAELGEIQPMRDRPEPVPEALFAGVPDDDFSGDARDVETCVAGVFERKAVERPSVHTVVADRPLVGFNFLRGSDGGRSVDDAFRR